MLRSSHDQGGAHLTTKQVQASPDIFCADQMLRRLLDAAPQVFKKLF